MLHMIVVQATLHGLAHHAIERGNRFDGHSRKA